MTHHPVFVGVIHHVSPQLRPHNSLWHESKKNRHAVMGEENKYRSSKRAGCMDTEESSVLTTPCMNQEDK
jgi:hypothetical protein